QLSDGGRTLQVRGLRRAGPARGPRPPTALGGRRPSQTPDRMALIEIRLAALVVIEVALPAGRPRARACAMALTTHRHRRQQHVGGLRAGVRLVAFDALDRAVDSVIEDRVREPSNRDASWQ